MSNEPNKPADDAARAQPTPPADPSVAEPAAPADPSGSAPVDPTPAPAPADPGSAAVPGRSVDGEERTAGSGTARKVVIGALIVVLAAVVVFGVVRLTGGGEARAGDCVSVSGQVDTADADVEEQDCDADRASFKVGQVVEGGEATCPEEGLYTEVPRPDNVKLCLLPNMVEGACYKPDEGLGFTKTECTGPETIKVTKVVQGSTDLEACPDSAGMSYPEPKVTYCLAPAEE
ncbi:LppU/SCO3897 family protein [Saccharothrix syringae]|uniref:Uncharacterized protein n=1 Tax=Saccharothrix syringae TaxID=103733 RepID=A0A5Q0GSX0_SACSY|nr:hypothetical protein [Saccharothrix syringae]QFZ16462.1 hypothetical protein EKG83_02390 [Saccharothrix syringae]